jgi:chaperonin GroEL (HSP60 family)
VYTGKIVDMRANNVIEPLRTKRQAVESAADAAIMILKIDDVVASKREAPMPPPGAGGMPGGMPPGGMY